MKPATSKSLFTLLFASVLLFSADLGCADDSIHFAGARPLFWGGLNIAADRYQTLTGVIASTMAGGCSQAVVGVERGRINVGGLCCLVDSAVNKRFNAIPIAKDAIAMVVNRGNPVSSLTLDQVRDIYHGKIREWKEVSALYGTITPVMRNHCDYRNEIFKREIIQNPKLLSPNVMTVDTIAKLITTVQTYKKAIGQTSTVFAMSDMRLKVLRLNGVAPTKENIASGEYPLSRVLSLITRKKPPPEVVKFVNWLKNDPEAKKIISKKLVLLSQ